ncbi:transposase [Marinomonas sp. 15G1-11]|uniref:Transposase n=1 Tax=Marinomonas phaeophyticola TaxID=3004091 RepID=A0ABT4JUK2_9GAMM|nr:transposase [Marinomonas sp. 15G1-11]MCZ2721901.1 transposase [Marinomonas sp. 15G1-11]
MPRKPRFFLPNVPVHIVQRGASRDPVFFEDEDYKAYVFWMKEAAVKYNVAIHAFVLMTNHVHILLTAQSGAGVSQFMQHIGRRYVPFINHKYGRSGSIWEGRFKSSLVQSDRYFLAVMRYIELNPVRANMVDHPSLYRWSSFHHNSGVKPLSFITINPIYNALGRNTAERIKNYIRLFEQHLDTRALSAILSAWQTGTPLGDSYFKEKVEAQLKQRVGQDYRGRPSKRGQIP